MEHFASERKSKRLSVRIPKGIARRICICLDAGKTQLPKVAGTLGLGSLGLLLVFLLQAPAEAQNPLPSTGGEGDHAAGTGVRRNTVRALMASRQAAASGQAPSNKEQTAKEPPAKEPSLKETPASDAPTVNSNRSLLNCNNCNRRRTSMRISN